MRLELATSGVASKPLPKRMPKKTAGNRTEPRLRTSSPPEVYPTEARLPGREPAGSHFAQDSPAHTPVQLKALRRCNQACHEQGGTFRRVTKSGQALVKINWHVKLGGRKQNTEYGSPEYGFLESSPQRQANASRRRQCSARTGSAFENRKRDRGDRNRPTARPTATLTEASGP